jgi:hypothetical protein
MCAIRNSARTRPEALCRKSSRAGQRLLRSRLVPEAVGASMRSCPEDAADEIGYERRRVA